MKTSTQHISLPSLSSLFTMLLACLAVLAVACGGSSTSSSSGSSGSEPTANQGGTTAESDAGDNAVEYEPAYPEDVSTGELSESDTAQQHTHDDGNHSDDRGHSHGDDEHSH